MTEIIETTTDATTPSTTVTASKMLGALASASRNAVAGVIEVDKALFGYARDAVTGYVELGKETIQAKSLSDVLDLHVARAHARIEATAANTREIVELTREKLSETYAPVKEVVAAYRAKDLA
ncbi:phasin family protein [Rubrimonas cliftonensis]|uniref:Phasin protein n=1 Tax=Rubrimonas cliftonensis TaxID=89524 RepID=A0A1H4FU17_9RHOB|nr:phasin family protein [Rubrimonas cliftonensis]SEB00641.1 Phasin protein [Rubrimonas cliftonensis]